MDFKFTGIESVKGNEIVAWLQSHQGQTYAACRPFADGIGISWQGQHEKLKSNPRFSCQDILMTGSDGKKYMMTCLPVEQLPDWVQSINAAKIRQDKRGVLLEVQKFFQQGLHALLNDQVVSREEYNKVLEVLSKLSDQVAYLMEENAQLRKEKQIGLDNYQRNLNSIGGKLLSGARQAKRARVLQ